MKITDINAYVVTPPGHGYGGPNERQWTFVKIDTDEGIHGWGECTNYPGGGSFLTARAVLAMKEVLIGEDPTNIEPLWHRLVPSVYVHELAWVRIDGDQRYRYCAVGHQG